MKIFDLIQLKNNSEATCHKCAHFQNDPTLIEEAYPGLTTMSSGFASVRDRDGICNYNQIYLSADDSCTHFKPHASKYDEEELHNTVPVQ